MEDLLRQGSDWLEEMRTRFLARTVTYVRGSQTVDVAASIGKTAFRIDKGYGVTERIESRDFLVLSEDLVLGGVQALPLRGDRVREISGTQAFIYEVMAPGNEPHYRYSDAYRKTLRIHTKLVGTEANP